jgi:hypothetical protein
MHHLPLEVIKALDLRVFGIVQLADRRHQEIRGDRIDFPVLGILGSGDLDLSLPLALGIVPACFFDVGAIADISVHVVLGGYALEVVL